MSPPAGPGQSPGGDPCRKVHEQRCISSDPKDTLDQLILSPFQKQNIKNEHNVNAPAL